MSEERPAGGSVTPIKPPSPVVVPLVTEAADAAEPVPADTEATLVPIGIPVPADAPVSAFSAEEPAAATTLAARLQALAVRRLPILWYRVTRVGPAGLIGAAATLAAVLIAVLALVFGRSTNDVLTAQIAHAHMQPPSAGGEVSVTQVVADLPRRQDIPAVVGLVLDQAHAANVSLENGHYTYTAPKSGTVGRYELEFPVKADYPSVRDFINRTLSNVPAAGLDKLRVERKGVGDPLVSADIRFVVFVRAEPQS